MKSPRSISSLGESAISTAEMRRIVDRLKLDWIWDSTKANYHSIWKTFNKFFLQLDVKPRTWEDCLVLYVGYLVKTDKKSQTVKSYISAIKNILRDDGVMLNEDKFLITSLTRACRLRNDQVITRLPIQKGLLHLIITKTEHFENHHQPYLSLLYQTVFSTMYFGMFRISEVAEGPHAIKVRDVKISDNKDKVLFILRSSKTHNMGNKPQFVWISSQPNDFHGCRGIAINQKCPFQLLRKYAQARPKYASEHEAFFVHRNRTSIKPHNVRTTLKTVLMALKLDATIYNLHSFRACRSVDLHKLGVSLDFIKVFGRWRSNAVYTYLKY